MARLGIAPGRRHRKLLRLVDMERCMLVSATELSSYIIDVLYTQATFRLDCDVVQRKGACHLKTMRRHGLQAKQGLGMRHP
jgi:hypothetical protein